MNYKWINQSVTRKAEEKASFALTIIIIVNMLIVQITEVNHNISIHVYTAH
jgi:hypothetical protein